MKVIGLKDTNLDACVSEAQNQRIMITRNGKPVALVVGVEGLDAEQLELGSDPAFWELMARRRRQQTITRAQLEEKIRPSAKRRSSATRHSAASEKGSPPDKVSRMSASFLGTGIGEAHKTTIRKGGATYSGKGVGRSGADKAAGDKHRKGNKDR